jgi:hypothetical protein
MITLQVNTVCTPWYVPLDDIHDSLRKKKMLLSLKEFSKMIAGSSVYVYERETKSKLGIYPHDVAAIFYLLDIAISFVDEKEEVLLIHKEHSGIMNWI